jgi:hypothetical protein
MGWAGVRLLSLKKNNLLSVMLHVHSYPNDSEHQTDHGGRERKEIQEERRWDEMDQHEERQCYPHHGKQKTESDQTPGWHAGSRVQ